MCTIWFTNHACHHYSTEREACAQNASEKQQQQQQQQPFQECRRWSGTRIRHSDSACRACADRQREAEAAKREREFGYFDLSPRRNPHGGERIGRGGE